MNRKLLVLIPVLLCLVSLASAGVENVTQAGSVITKPLLGLLISLGIENFVSAVDAVYLYNLIAVAIILVGAAMAGARSEAAFCILIPLMAGVLEWFGWLRMTSATTHLPTQTGQMGLMAVTIVAGILGMIIYMKAQDRESSGSGGSGSLIFKVAIFIAAFNISLGIITGFATFPLGAQSPIDNACVVGFSCDEQGNYDFTTTMTQVGASAGTGNDVYTTVTGFAGAIGSMALIFLGLMASLVTFPVWFANLLGSIWPWFESTALYTGLIAALGFILIVIYMFGLWEFISNRQGSTL